MSGRVTKSSKSRKTSERSVLAEWILESGALATMPCTYCFKQKKKCLFSEGSSRCSECAGRGRACDGVLVASSLTRILEQRRKLTADEEAAGDAIIDLQEKQVELQKQQIKLQKDMAAAVARLSRIRTIRRRVHDKGTELFKRGMEELDQEDGLLPMLDAHEKCLVEDLQVQGVPNDVDWSSFGLGDEFIDATPLVDPSLLIVEGTPEVSGGSS